MTPADIIDTIRLLGLTRRQFGELVGYPEQTVHRWCAGGRGNVPAPAALAALLLVLRDLPEDARAASLALLGRHKLRNRRLSLAEPASPLDLRLAS